MDVLDLLLRIEKQLSKAKDNRDRSSLEKIYYTLVVIDDSISALDNNSNNNNISRVITFDELARQLNDQTKQNIKEDVKKSRVRVPRIRRDVVKDGNHPLLAELDDRLKEIRQQQQFDQQIKKDKDEDGGSDNKSNNDDNSVESTIDRMLDDVSIALDDYDNYKISFEIGAEQYNNLKKWQKSIDDRLFRYQLETGKMWPGCNDELYECVLESFKLIAKEGGNARPYYGTCGGAYLYKFLSTSVGLITKVENVVTKEEIDLTDYESL